MSDLTEQSYDIKKQEALLFDNISKPIESEAAIFNVPKQISTQSQSESWSQIGDRQKDYSTVQLKKHKRTKIKCKKGKIIANFINKSQSYQQEKNKKSALITKLKCIITKREPIFKQTLSKAQLINNIFALIDRNLRLVSFESSKGDFKKYYPIKKPKEYEFLDEDEELKFRQKNIVAQAFCIVDHGHIPVIKYMGLKGVHVQLSESRYKSSIQAVVIEGYRQLQRFLYCQCKINIFAIPRSEIKKIRGVIFNCRLTLNQEQWLTFLNFIRVMYGFSDACIVKSTAIKLYISVLNILKERLKQFPVHQKRQQIKRKGLSKNYFKPHYSQRLRQIWNLQYQKQLLETFKQNQSFQYIKDHFQKLYPKNRQYFTRLALQSRFHHIIRVALKKMKKLVDEGYSAQLQLMKWDDKIVKKILASIPGCQLRLKLIDIYNRPQQIQFAQLASLVNMVNTFIKNKGQTGNQNQAPQQLPKKKKESKKEDAKQQQQAELSVQISSELQRQVDSYLQFQNNHNQLANQHNLEQKRQSFKNLPFGKRCKFLFSQQRKKKSRSKT